MAHRPHNIHHFIDSMTIFMSQTNPLTTMKVMEDITKMEENSCMIYDMSNAINGGKVIRENENVKKVAQGKG